MVKRYMYVHVHVRQQLVPLNNLDLSIHRNRNHEYTGVTSEAILQWNSTILPSSQGSQHLQCQYGPKYYKAKPKKGKQLRLQGTRKIGCPAHIDVKQYTLFPDYRLEPGELQGKTKHQIRLLREEKMQKLRNEIQSGRVKQTTRYWLSLPTAEAHEKMHPVKQSAAFSQKLIPLQQE